MSAVPDTECRLSPVEIESALKEFSAADWSRAESIATVACAGLVGWTPEDLLQEAMTKLLGSERTCPIGVHPLVMLKNAMRSIASNARKQHDEGPIDDGVALDYFGSVEDSETRPVVSGESVSNPQQVAAAREALAEIEKLTADDEELALLVMVWAEGLRGDEAIEVLDWNKNKYEAARKRLTRRLSTLATEWSPK